MMDVANEENTNIDGNAFLNKMFLFSNKTYKIIYCI